MVLPIEPEAASTLLRKTAERALTQDEKAALVDFVSRRIAKFSVNGTEVAGEAAAEATAFAYVCASIRIDWPGAEKLEGIFQAARNAAWRGGSPVMVLFWEKSLANRELAAGDLESVRERMRRAIEFAHGSEGHFENPLVQAPWLSARLAWIQASIGLSEFEEARRLLDELERDLAAPDSNLARIPWAEEQLLGQRAQYWLELGRADLAAEASERQLARVRESEDPDVIASALVRAANIDLAARSFEGVIERYEQAKRLAGEHPVAPLYLAHLEIQKGQAERELELEDRERPARAAETLRAALASPDLPATLRILGRLTLADAEIARSNFAAARVELENAERESSASASDRGSPIEVIAARLATLRFRLESLAPDVLPADVPEIREELTRAVEGLFSDWGQSRAGERLVAFLNRKEYRDLLVAWIRATLAVDSTPRGAEQCFDLLVRAQRFGSLAEAIGGTRKESLATVREQWLGKRGLLLMYLPAVEGTILIAVDSSEIAIHSLPGSRRLDEVRRGFIRYVSRRPEERGAVDRMETPESVTPEFLPNAVIAKLATHDELTIVGYELLGAIPFEGFQVAGKFLGVTHSIVYAPSIRVGLALSERAAEPRSFERSLVALDRPTLSEALAKRFPGLDTFSNVPDVRGELETIYGSERIHWWAGASATREHLDESAYVLQIFGHGVFDARVDPPTSIALAACDRDPIGLLSIRDLPLRDVAPLVIQASCSAAKGPLVRGEDGLSHFGGAWLRAGATTVILPSQDVNVFSTLRFLEAFHAQLAGHHDTPAEAARAAREELANDPRFSDPYYFAAIHVYGFGRERLAIPAASKPANRNSLAVIALAVITAIGAALYFGTRSSGTQRPRSN